MMSREIKNFMLLFIMANLIIGAVTTIPFIDDLIFSNVKTGGDYEAMTNQYNQAYSQIQPQYNQVQEAENKIKDQLNQLTRANNQVRAQKSNFDQQLNTLKSKINLDLGITELMTPVEYAGKRMELFTQRVNSDVQEIVKKAGIPILGLSVIVLGAFIM
jgi:septal ring factor EnvC (AmiA/AmiB activator)